VAAEHGNIRLLEKMWEWGKHGTKISKGNFSLPRLGIGKLPQDLSKNLR
jgi:hypothetical protein